MMRHLLILAALSLVTLVAHALPRAELTEMRLASGAHPPGDAPDVVVHVSSHFDAQKPLELVVFLHGFDCCARSMVSAVPTPCRTGERPHKGWDLAGIHERAGTSSVLVVPQLAYLARTARQHRFAERGAFDRMVTELLAGPLRSTLGVRTLADIKHVTLVAHSGGYGALVPILRDDTRKLNVDRVVMLDALYAGWDVLARWLLATRDARLVSLHTGQQQTVQGNEALASLLRERRPVRSISGSLAEAVATSPVLIARVKSAHAAIPGAHLADVLRGLARAN